MTPNRTFFHIPSRRSLTSLAGVALVLCCLLAAFFWTLGQDTAQAATDAGPDLTAEISIEPSVPGLNEQVTIRVILRNKGTSAVNPPASISVHLYVDPVDQPPKPGTPGGYPVINLFLNSNNFPAGGSAPGERTYTFTTIGCNHTVYAWVDRDDLISEDNETNNLIALPLCVGVKCEVDSYENDSQCSAANWLSETGPEARSFCNPVNQDLDDEDWIKFTALTEVTYTLSTSNLGQHAAPKIILRSACGGAEVASGLTNLAWQPPVAGVYYANIQNNSDLQGPLTAYSLTLSSATGLTDNFEPDDTCATAREIPTDGTKQTRIFQAPGDTDWLRFTAKAGESFAVISSGSGTGVNPLITLFSSCNQSRGKDNIAQNFKRVEASSPGDQVYYARIVNQDPNRFGASATYDMEVRASACASDDSEEDDSFAQAKTISVGAPAKTHGFCPAGDQDWVKFTLTKTQVYVLQTSNLGSESDTVLTLYDDKGGALATNDDYDYVSASRITFDPPNSGEYYAMVRHRNPEAAGLNTNYDLSLETGFCDLDGADTGNGDNGPAEAANLTPNGAPQSRNFCADPFSGSLGDQDWLRFPAVAGGVYRISTGSLGLNSDTVLRLYDRDGATLLETNDDSGAGRSASIVFTPTISGDYFVRVTQFNSAVFGQESDYTVELQENIPPTPTPTATPVPSPTPTPTPLPTVDPSGVKTLILTNRKRLESLYGPIETSGVMAKLFELADHEKVAGAVVLVENNAAVAAAYAAWTANATSLANNTLANNVADAIRGLVLSLLSNGSNIEYVVIVGDDRVIPFRRIGEGALSQVESDYAQSLAGTSTVAAALAQDMILTDDYYTDKEPSQWKGNELYIPDYSSSRLIETPAEIIGVIDTFLAGQETNLEKALATGWDFVEDSANIIGLLTSNDTIATTKLLGNVWTGDQLRQLQLQANPSFDFQSINGHSTHTATLVPLGVDITAADIVASPSDLSRAIIFAVGCHGGLNDPNTLDLPQAFMRKHANYVGNTGFGWGGGGVVYSEAVMRNYARELLRDARAAIGPALVAAKQKYYSSSFVFGAYDAKSLMQVTLYGLPMYEVISGGTLADGDPFPSADDTFTPPTSFSNLNVGTLSYSLAGNFGDNSSPDGSFNDLDGNVSFSAGTPIQPNYYADVSAPTAGSLRGVLFLGGTYADKAGFDPVVARPDNEYVDDTTEPSFSADGWYPAVPFSLQSGENLSSAADTLLMSLGQYDPTSDTQRTFSQMTLNTLYSFSVDSVPADIEHLDGVLDEAAGTGLIKVETYDDSGIERVVVAYTSGVDQWLTKDLAFDAGASKWTGTITSTDKTLFFIQVVDGAGNVAVNDNKGQYYPVVPPLPLVQGQQIERKLYLPAVER